VMINFVRNNFVRKFVNAVAGPFITTVFLIFWPQLCKQQSLLCYKTFVLLNNKLACSSFKNISRIGMWVRKEPTRVERLTPRPEILEN
jgi:hypothetical protein